MLLWFTPLLLMASPHARPADPVQAVMRQAHKAEADFELERALELWQGVIADDSISEAERFEANLRAGHLARVLERDEQARMHYLYVLRRSPTFQLPVETGPKIRSFFELVRQEVADGRPTPAPRVVSAIGEEPDPDEPPPPPPPRLSRATRRTAERARSDEDPSPAPGWLAPAGLTGVGLGIAGLIGGAVCVSMGLAEAYLAETAKTAAIRSAHQEQSTGWYLGAAVALPLGLASLVGGVVLASIGLSSADEIPPPPP